MTTDNPAGDSVDHDWLARLLGDLPKAPEARLDLLSEAFLGRPYIADSLSPFPGPEHLITRLDGFDCVTYVESVLALSACQKPADFALMLAGLRYFHGIVEWQRRNHYMTLWLERNAEHDRVEVLDGPGWITEPAPRRLSSLVGYPSLERSLRYLPVHDISMLDGRIRTGDPVFFVTTRNDLDFFHTGLLVQGKPIRVRHASRSQGRVVEESLCDFADTNRPMGFVAAHPHLSKPGSNA